MDTSALPVRANQVEIYATREAWLAARISGIGASESAAILGIEGACGSPLGIYADKRGMMPDDCGEAPEHIRWGLRLEHAIARGYAEDTRRKICIAWPVYVSDATAHAYGLTETPHVIVRHPSIECIFASPDALQWDAKRGWGVLQIKTAHSGKLADWSGDEPPHAYVCQVQQEMLVTGCKWGTLACLVGGNKLRHFDIEADSRFHRIIETQLIAFWQRVLTEDAPPADGTLGSAEALRQLYPYDNGDIVEIGETLDEIDERLQSLRGERKAADAEIERLEQQLKQIIGERSGVRSDNVVYSWRTSVRKAYQVEATEVRTLRRKAVNG